MTCIERKLKQLLRPFKIWIEGGKRISKNFYAKRPVSHLISKKASIKVSGVLWFNYYQNRAQKVKSCGYISLADNSELICDGEFSFHTGCKVEVLKGAKLKLGNGYMNYDSKLYCYNRITIGDGTIISEDVTIRDSDNHEIIGNATPKSAPIVIGDHVWIGMNATILKGVTIGNGSVIAANALVNKDIPDNCLAAGVPAKIIKANIEWKM